MTELLLSLLRVTLDCWERAQELATVLSLAAGCSVMAVASLVRWGVVEW